MAKADRAKTENATSAGTVTSLEGAVGECDAVAMPSETTGITGTAYPFLRQPLIGNKAALFLPGFAAKPIACERQMTRNLQQGRWVSRARLA